MKLSILTPEILSGMLRAGTLYHRMSGGDAPWWAPEAFFRDHVARSLHRNHGVYVSLEETAQTLRERGRGRVTGRYPRNSKTGRLDMVVWNDDGSIKAVVEFKRRMTVQRLESDAKRLGQLVQLRTASHGLIATYGRYISKTRALESLNRIQDEMDVRSLGYRIRTGGPADDPSKRRTICYVVFRALAT